MGCLCYLAVVCVCVCVCVSCVCIFPSQVVGAVTVQDIIACDSDHR